MRIGPALTWKQTMLTAACRTHGDCLTRCRPRGFSLVELVVVIAVLAIVASIAIPRFASAAGHHRLNAAAMRVAHDLELAQARARASSASVKVTFDPGTDTYRISGMRHIDRSPVDYVVSLGRDPHRVLIAAADFGGDAEVIFDGYGVADSGGTVVLGGAGRQKVVALDADTGQAGILDPQQAGAGG